LDYYQSPAELEPDDDFPIARLVEPIKVKAITRVHVYNNELGAAKALGPFPENTIGRIKHQ